jgi:hypothetical protein
MEELEIAPARLAALLQGVVPCFEPHLARAYGDGLRLATRGGAGGGVAHEELHIKELVPLLSGSGEGRWLALHTLRAMQIAAEHDDAAAAVLLDALGRGVMPLVFRAAAEAAERLELESTDTVTTPVAEMTLCAAIVESAVQRGGGGGNGASQCALSSHDLGVSSEAHFRWLVAAGMAMMRDAIEESSAGTAIAGIEMEAAAQLVHAFYDLRKRSGTHAMLADSCLTGDLCERRFVHACCVALRRFPNSPIGTAAIRAVYTGCNFVPFIECMLDKEVAGYSTLLDAISSTMHDARSLAWLIGAVSNSTVASAKTARIMAELGAFRALQPALFAAETSVVVRAAYSISSLSMFKEVAELLGKSDVLEVCETVLRTVLPGSHRDTVTTLGASDMKAMEAMLSEDSPLPVWLSTLHMVATVASPRNIRLLSAPSFVARLRACAAISDAFVYTAAITILRALGLAFPSYRSHAAVNAEAEDAGPGLPAQWNVDAVCSWVGTQIFASYRGIFREGLVTGRVLLELSEDDLAEIGISHRLHRRTILHAIGDLKAASEAPAAVGGGSAARLLSVARPSAVPMYDVFLSYRRIGGADFAQLLKVELQARGLRVFLDIDNLGTGKFDDALQMSLGRSKNVVLVWTRGCMDRFFVPLGPNEMDFVREEYASALRLQKNIIPLYKEDFSFPKEEDMPPVVAPVLRINAVKWVSEYRDASLQKLLERLEK